MEANLLAFVISSAGEIDHSGGEIIQVTVCIQYKILQMGGNNASVLLLYVWVDRDGFSIFQPSCPLPSPVPNIPLVILVLR